ncbi:RING-H2 finger protein ATL46-like [Sesbania bispinosa]|nr:RING-H2 finger protein ATL46-like [Sesbania bispinosa]
MGSYVVRDSYLQVVLTQCCDDREGEGKGNVEGKRIGNTTKGCCTYWQDIILPYFSTLNFSILAASRSSTTKVILIIVLSCRRYIGWPITPSSAVHWAIRPQLLLRSSMTGKDASSGHKLERSN